MTMTKPMKPVTGTGAMSSIRSVIRLKSALILGYRLFWEFAGLVDPGVGLSERI